MANLQVKNLPEALHGRLRRYAWQERLAQRPATDLGTSAASLLEDERSQRQREFD